jgi:hypothetical protein
MVAVQVGFILGVKVPAQPGRSTLNVDEEILLVLVGFNQKAPTPLLGQKALFIQYRLSTWIVRCSIHPSPTWSGHTWMLLSIRLFLSTESSPSLDVARRTSEPSKQPRRQSSGTSAVYVRPLRASMASMLKCRVPMAVDSPSQWMAPRQTTSVPRSTT